ncbi:MAG: CoA-binding protein [Deltaproteobacteria bacterium]|nr:CoA-binding protein [Deltaproteobacteria bacterium]
MDFFFDPDGIAVIGANDNPMKGGYHILRNVLGGYEGPVYPVNPRFESLQGIPCYQNLESIPERFDLVIYFISADHLPSTIEACAGKGVRGIIIESAGFAEVGPGGRALQKECVSLAAKHHMRLWGPNCMGLLDAHRRHVFSFMYTEDWKTLMNPGNCSFIVQSGMLSAGFLMMILERGGLHISKMCSIGNKCDVNETELLEYLIADDDSEVIGLYIESIVEPRRFMELCRSTDKPIVVLKGGRSPSGARAAMSHTASLAGDDRIMRNAFAQAGVTPVYDVTELMDLMRGFSKTKGSRNNGGTAVITFSGGSGIVTADFLNDYGLPLAQLSDETLHAVKEVFPPWMEPSNPVDVWPAIEKNGVEKVYSHVIEAIMHDDGVDSLIIHVFSFMMTPDVLKPLNELKDRLAKPVAVWGFGMRDSYEQFRKGVEETGIPVFDEIERGVRFIAAAKKHFHRHSPAR